MERLRRFAPRLSQGHGLRLKAVLEGCSVGARFGAATLALLSAARPAQSAVEALPAKAIAGPSVISAAIDPGPLWVAQATWDVGEEHLVVADPESGKIYVYNPDGRLDREVVKPGQGPLEFAKPAYPFVVGDRYLVGSNFYHWIWLDKKFEPVDSLSLEWEDPKLAEYRQLFLYSLDAGATKFFGIGDVQAHDLNWSLTAMFAVPFAAPGKLEKLGAVEADDEEIAAYHSYPTKVAACGDQVYLLRMAPTLSLEKFGASRSTLRSFPEAFRQRANLPPLKGRDSVQERWAAMRMARLADGLFCVEDRWLLVVAHQPMADGGTQWLVYPVDPTADTIAPPIELPTRAAEIVFVPGKRRWAVLEKGPMRQVGVQPLQRLITFPRPALGRFESPR